MEASNRLSTEAGRRAAQARTGPVRPLGPFAQGLKLEQVAHRASACFGNHHVVRLRNALQARSKVRRLAYDGLLLRSTRADKVADDHQPRCDADTRL